VRAYREAAAVLESIADLEQLRPAGPAPAGQAAELLEPDLVRTTGSACHGTVMLRPQVRAETISDLVADGRVGKALDANPRERSGLLQGQLERYLTGPPGPLARTLPELEATLQVAVWLAGVVDGVPEVAEVQARVEYLRLLAQFEALAGDEVFRGRRRELDRLRGYIGVVAQESTGRRVGKRLTQWAMPERQPAISISGIGGAGKSSLVARFMLEHTRLAEEERIPFGYLDFARISLDVGEPVGLCRELLRQLDLQFPEQHFARGFGFLDDWRPRRSGDGSRVDTADTIGPAMSVLTDILGMLRSRLGPRPYVIVLDTFEEIQYQGEERAFPFWELLSRMQDGAPFLRVVAAGRAPVESLVLAGREPRQIVLGDLDVDAAAAFLETQGIADPLLQRGFVETFGCMPLSLKLATSLAARTPGGAAALLGPDADGLALAAASDEVLQARLYGRILDWIADERVCRLAHPGLTLRRINPDIILNVLNEPCELLITSIDEATSLFGQLRRETSLVSVDSGDGDLVHRPDLRRVMLTMMLAGSPAQAEEIHRRALAWYGGDAFLGRGLREQAEYVYHWLQLRHPDSDDTGIHRALNQREVRASIQAAVDEFPVETQLWLAALGFKVSAAVRERATRDQDHAAIAAQIEDLLPYGERATAEAERIFESAYAGLRDYGAVRSIARSAFGRADRGASPVFLAGARIAAQRGDDERALALIGEGLERAARDDDPGLTLGLLKERAWLYRDRSAAEQAAGLELLAAHAVRAGDAAARLQHRAQSVYGDPGAVDAASLSALLEQLGRADALAVWHVLPALGRAIALANGLSVADGSFRMSTSVSSTTTTTTTADGTVVRRSSTGPLVIADRLAPLVLDPASPFRTAVFADPAGQDALNAVTAAASADSARQVADRFLPASGGSPPAGAISGWRSAVRAITGTVRDAVFAGDEESGALSPAHQVVFLTAVIRLCNAWPYRILYVEPPRGRGVTSAG